MTVDGTAVTSPYTLTKDCTIRVTSQDSNHGMLINGLSYTESKTISLSKADIIVGGARVPSIGTQVVVTINYTA